MIPSSIIKKRRSRHAASAPRNTMLPVISGTLEEGDTLAVTNGTWAYVPASYACQWKRDGGNIASATAATHVIVDADLGTTITATVTATNANGSGSATSAGVDIPEPVSSLPDVASSTRLLDLQADALVLSDGAAVSTWADASGLAHDFTQSGDARPTYHTGGGTPYVLFDGGIDENEEIVFGDDSLIGSDFADNLTNFTVFTVINLLPGVGSVSLSKCQVPTDDTPGWGILGGQAVFFQTDVNNTVEVSPDLVLYNARYVCTAEITALDKDHVTLYRNGVDVTDTRFSEGAVTSIANSEPIRINTTGDPDNDGYLPMQLYAQMIYAPAPDASDRAAIETWLAGKYGITL